MTIIDVLLTAVSRVFKIAVCHRLCHHLQVNNISVLEQYGFKKRLPSENAA
jgi:hypothetical protein